MSALPPRADIRPRSTPTQKTGSEPPPTSRHGRKRHSSDKMRLRSPVALQAPPNFGKKSMLLSNPRHFTLQGTQRMDFMRQGNGGAVHIDRRPNVRFVPKADIMRRSKKPLSFNQLIGAVE